MSNIDPNEDLLRALGYESIEEIPGSAGRTITKEDLDNADPKLKELAQKIRALDIQINKITYESGDTSFSAVRGLIALKSQYQQELIEIITPEVKEEFKLTPADLRKKRLARYGKKRQGGILRYPLESMTQHTDYLQIDIEKYEAIGSNYITSTGSDDPVSYTHLTLPTKA